MLQLSAGNVTSCTLGHSLSATPDLRYAQMIHKATFFESKALAGTKWRGSLHLRFSFSLVSAERSVLWINECSTHRIRVGSIDASNHWFSALTALSLIRARRLFPIQFRAFTWRQHPSCYPCLLKNQSYEHNSRSQQEPKRHKSSKEFNGLMSVWIMLHPCLQFLQRFMNIWNKVELN